MEVTFEELVTKHTRRELEEIALKYGVENLGGPKSQLAEAILEAAKKEKDSPKPATEETRKVVQMVEKSKDSPKPATEEAPKVVQMAEKPKASVRRSAQPAKTGVMAKVSAINNKYSELLRAGRDIRDEGIREMNAGVKEFHSATDKMSRDMATEIGKMQNDGQQRFNAGQAAFKSSLDAQKKENRESAAKFGLGAKEIRSATQKMGMDFQKTGRNIRENGIRNMQKNLNQFTGRVNSQIKANQEAVFRINSAARDLHQRSRAFQEEVHRYQEHDLKNYIRDFYYG